MAVPITNFNYLASLAQSGATPHAKSPVLPQNPKPVDGDAFVAGGLPVWEPPTVPPGFTPINFTPGGGYPGGLPGGAPGGYPGPPPDWPPANFGGYTPLTLGPPPDWQPPDPKLGFTHGDLKKPGSLVVVDQFVAPMPSFGIGGFSGPVQQAHGHLVSESAKGDGFAGNLIPSEYNGKYHQERSIITQALNEPDLPREEFLKRLEMSVALQGVGLLDAMSDRLDGLKEAGLNHSAVNLSYGMSQASAVQDKYIDAAMAWGGWGPVEGFKKPLLDNYARAFDLDSAKLSSQDPAVSGPERMKFQQALADHIGGIMDNNPALRESKEHFATSVRELEKNHNSVVVAASNEGSVLKELAQEANSDVPIRVGSRFQDNILATPETTVVGSTTGSGSGEKVADYSSNYEGVDIYANGFAPMPSSTASQTNAQGTSFASPKVGQVMAQLHQLYPDKTSDEIENMVKEQLSHQLLSYDGNVQRPVLNQQADFGMLSRYT